MAFFLTLAGVYVAALIFLLAVEDKIVFIPDRAITETPADHGVPFEDLFATTSDGVKIHGWWLPAAKRGHGEGEVGPALTRESGRPRATVIFAHGNAGNISDRADNAVRLCRLGLNVLLFDYRGYGRSEGSPTEQGVYRDAEAMLRLALSRKDVDPAHILYFGRSLGGAIALELARRHRPRGLIVESSFCSLRDLAWQLFPYALFAPFLPRHYDNLTKIAAVSCPVMVIHGNRDEVIPFSHGRRLFEAAREPKRFYDMGGGHGDFFGVKPAEYLAKVDEFLREME